MRSTKKATVKGLRERLRSDISIDHFVDVHVVNITVEVAFSDLCCFGSTFGFDFERLDLVVEVFYVDLVEVRFAAVGATARVFCEVVVERGEG